MIDKIRSAPVFLPLSFIYGTFTDLRNYLYNRSILKKEKFPIPVISIGNITAGGTGKTPFVIFLIDHLKKHYNNICVVSRGYGRESAGVKIVSDGSGHIIPFWQAGDEPVLIAGKHRDIPVIVAEKREKAIKLAIQKFNPDLILMDDAFQHRAVERSCDIVLIDCSRPVHQEKLLPVGNLRERLYHLDRASIVVFSKCESYPQDEIRFIRQYFKSDIYVSGLETKLEGSEIKKTVIAFAGIANPELFVRQLKSQHVEIGEFIKFKDHHHYTGRDIEKLKQKATRHDTNILITTEKDYLKLNGMDFTGFRLITQNIEIKMENVKNLLKSIHKYIDIRL